MLPARILATGGAGLVALGFFFPWVDGAAEFASRDFSGLDLARLMRNFEIVASSSNEAGKFTLTALVLYLAPALAVNGAAVTWLTSSRRVAAAGAAVAAVYVGSVLAGVALVSAAGDTDAERVLGGLLIGFASTLAGALALAVSSLLLVWGRAAGAD
jgi:hypothetical protein